MKFVAFIVFHLQRIIIYTNIQASKKLRSLFFKLDMLVKYWLLAIYLSTVVSRSNKKISLYFIYLIILSFSFFNTFGANLCSMVKGRLTSTFSSQAKKKLLNSVDDLVSICGALDWIWQSVITLGNLVSSQPNLVPLQKMQ